jgi:hypothetical protein
MNEHDVVARSDVPRREKVADSNAWSLQISQNRDRPIRFIGYPPNHRNRFFVLLVSAVRKIEAGYVHARLDKSFQR